MSLQESQWFENLSDWVDLLAAVLAVAAVAIVARLAHLIHLIEIPFPSRKPVDIAIPAQNLQDTEADPQRTGTPYHRNRR